MFQRVSIVERHRCRLSGIVDGEHVLAVEQTVVDAGDIGPLVFAVDGKRLFVEDGTKWTAAGYRAGCHQRREAGVAHHDEAKLSVGIGGRHQIGVLANGAGFAVERHICVFQLPMV